MSRRGLNRLDARLLRLQSPTRPWAICLRAHTSEAVTADELADALRESGSHSEIWCARLARGPDTAALTWRTEPDGWPEVGRGPFDRCLDRAFRLHDQAPVQLAVDRNGSGSIVQLKVNHAFADGRGALLLLRALMGTLAGQRTEPLTALGDDDLGRLPRLGPWAQATLVARRAVQARRRVASFGLDGRDGTVTATEVVRVDDLDRWRSRHPQTTVNDVVIAATHIALGEVLGPTRPVSVGVPIDLRRTLGSPPGLGNAVVSVSTFSHGDTGTVAGTAARLGATLRHDAEPAALGSLLGVMMALTRPGEPRSRPRSGPSWPETAVCSNLGMVADDPAWTGVERLDFSPPAHVVPVVGVVTFRSTMSIMVRLRGGPDLAVRLATRIAALLRYRNTWGDQR